MKSEQYNEDVTDICEFIHKYVPGHDESDDWNKKPEKKPLSGGDYLTFERHKQAVIQKKWTYSIQASGRANSKNGGVS